MIGKMFASAAIGAVALFSTVTWSGQSATPVTDSGSEVAACCPDGSCCPDGECCVAAKTTASASCCPLGICCPGGPCCAATEKVAAATCCPDGDCCPAGSCCPGACSAAVQ